MQTLRFAPRRPHIRRKLAGHFRQFLLAAILGTGMATGALASPLQLTPEQLRAHALVVAASGHREEALAMIAALLLRDPEDFAAHLISSRIKRDMGDTDGALVEARTASMLAKNQTQKYSASMLVAQALATAGRRTEAQLWLRWPQARPRRNRRAWLPCAISAMCAAAIH